MKSVHDMTADEIAEARKTCKVYGTVMHKLSRLPDGDIIYADVEDFCPFTLRATIAAMKPKGWTEVPDNRYIKAGCHPDEACKKADANLQSLAFGADYR